MKFENDFAAARLDRRVVLAGAASVGLGLLLVRPAHAAEPVEVVEGGGGTAAVEIASMSFKTPVVNVKVGESVTWTNNDDMAHNVHMRQGPAKGKPYAQGKMLNKGETYTLKFNEAGEYSYICTPHPMMKGKVVVA